MPTSSKTQRAREVRGSRARCRSCHSEPRSACLYLPDQRSRRESHPVWCFDTVSAAEHFCPNCRPSLASANCPDVDARISWLTREEDRHLTRKTNKLRENGHPFIAKNSTSAANSTKSLLLTASFETESGCDRGRRDRTAVLPRLTRSAIVPGSRRSRPGRYRRAHGSIDPRAVVSPTPSSASRLWRDQAGSDARSTVARLRSLPLAF